jgi:urease accessory protein
MTHTTPNQVLSIRERLKTIPTQSATITLTLNFDLRQKHSLRITMGNGKEVLLSLPRGSVLRDGEYLCADDGTVVQVRAEAEPVSVVYIDDNTLLAKVAYQLGVQRVPVQIGCHWLRYKHNPLVNEIVTAIGLDVEQVDAPFEPENIQYSS